MLTLDSILFGVLLPAAIAGAGALTIGWTGGDKDGEGNAWGGSVFVSLGYAAGHAGLLGWPAFPPGEATQWLLYLGLAALVPALVEAFARPSFWLRWLLRTALVAATLGTLLQPMIRHTWRPGTTAAWLAALVALLLLLAFLLDRLLPGLPAASAWSVLLLPSAGAAVALGLTGSLQLGQLGGVLSACLGGTLAAALVGRRTAVARASLPPPLILLFGLLICGHFYSELPAASALLLLAAPAAAAVPDRWLPRRDSVAGGAVRLGAVALPVAAAVLIAVRSSPPLEAY